VRHIPEFDRDIRAGTWHYSSTGPVTRATQLTLGILGLGRIGRGMAKIARDCFGSVIACDPYIDAGDFPDYVRRVNLESLFGEADVLSLHVPLNDETRGIVNRRTLALMKSGAILVNTSRGSVVDVDALAAALSTGHLRSAGLDVLPREPMPADHPIMKDPRVLLTPHSAFYSVEGEKELRTKAAQNLVDWALTGRPTYVVVEGR